MKARIVFALILIGLVSFSAQIVLMRQLLIVFYGNELSLGITLGVWLLGASLGSGILGRWLSPRIKDKVSILGFLQVIVAFFLLLSLLGARLIPFWLGYSPGEIIGVLPMLLGSLLILGLVSILGGLLFVLGCGVYEAYKGSSPGIGYVYILEAIGSSLGGLLTTLILIPLLKPLYIMWLIGLLNILSALLILRRRRFFILALILAFVYLLGGFKLEFLRNYSLGLQWRGFRVLASEDSVYGNIAVVKRDTLLNIFNNGLYSFTFPDLSTSERNAHFPLLQHPSPQEVLLIAGGSSGQLREVLKHPVKRVDYVELDPLMIKIAEKILPTAKYFKDKRVRIITNMDGRLYIKTSKYKYDVIIINLPEPHTAQLNRFYTQEFYQEVKALLKEDGILSFVMYSNPNYLSEEQVKLYSTLRGTLESVFPEVVITPGEVNYFLASKKKGVLTLDWKVLIQRLKQRGITARYVREYYLFSELSSERIDFFKERLSSFKDNLLNKDLRPIAYYYDLVLWNTFFKYNLKKVFKAITPLRLYLGCGLVFLFLLLSPLFISPERRNKKTWPVFICIATTGFSEIAFQIITLLSFQILYGYVYYKLGLILTSYMLGLILGAWMATRVLERDRGDYNLFLKTQFSIFLYPLVLPVVLVLFLNLKDRISFWVGSNLVFPFLPFIPGFIGGFQFPLGNELYLKAKGSLVTGSASLTYGLDLFGSFIGAILISLFLLPILGIISSCLLVAGLNFIGLVLLLGFKKN